MAVLNAASRISLRVWVKNDTEGDIFGKVTALRPARILTERGMGGSAIGGNRSGGHGQAFLKGSCHVQDICSSKCCSFRVDVPATSLGARIAPGKIQPFPYWSWKEFKVTVLVQYNGVHYVHAQEWLPRNHQPLPLREEPDEGL